METSTRKLSADVVHAFFRATTLMFAVMALSARADWPSTNATKWVQFPDPSTNGFDILATQPAAGALPLILADDFLCKRTGPISDIHLWASWLNDSNVCNLPITLSIWTDVPAITNGPTPIPSHPGSLLWKQTFGPGQYSVRPWKTADETFWNPDPKPFGTILGRDHLIWQYNFYPTDPFIQQGSAAAPVVYWLAMSGGAVTLPFGWKTSTNHWNDDAVFGHLDAGGNAQGDWNELRDPRNSAGNGRSLDLSFALTTRQVITNPPPPTNKWVQYPDQFNGLDVNATKPIMAADDFLCTTAGTITNIQLWTSWRDDAQPSTTTVITLGIWSDVPASPTTGTNTYSHPGNLLWTETFTPGTYQIIFYTNGVEQFYDPDTGLLTPETKIWRYVFNPRRPFCQKGSTNAPIVYWLSAYAQQTPVGTFWGWKTSTNHWNDDAVYGHVTATGTAVGDWRELHDPRLANLVSLDLAFLLNNGPPSADCDPQLKPKFIQYPDPSTNGLDVKATKQKILADDFLCRRAGPINGVTVWGSWLGDKVDTNTLFQLSLWTDVPAQPGTTNNFSHPGQLLCTQTFYPPHILGTSLQRYNYRLDVTNVFETWYDPNIPGTNGFLGNDTQIWRYDFYPRLPCWRQDGAPTLPRIYWLSVSATTTDLDKNLFGWKTSTNHFQDDGVYGHVDAAGNPIRDWLDLHDPRTGKSLDLSFALRTFPIVGINKDLKNLMTQTAFGIQIIVVGIHEITWHYDDSPPWPNFNVSYAGGNTVLRWTGKTVAPNVISHVGFEMAGTTVTILSMGWLNGAGTVIGTPIQVNHHTWNSGGTLTLDNNIVGAPVTVLGGTMELFADPVPLDQMVPNGTRNPIATFPLPIQPGQMAPGCPMRIPLPQRPPTARYVMFMLNLGDEQGQPATMDFVQLPLDMAVQPLIHSADTSAGNFMLGWPTIPGRMYRLQMSPDPTVPNSFFDVFTDLSMEDGNDLNIAVPISGGKSFYRIVLDPE